MIDATNELALDLAAKLREPDDILKQYGMTQSELQQLMQTEKFKSQYREAHALWHSPKNTLERIQAKSGMALEDALGGLHDLSKDTSAPPAARLDAIKQLSRLAGAEQDRKKDGPAVSGPGFSLTINFSGGAEPRVIEGTATEIEGD